MANNIEKLLACLVSPVTALEDALQQLKSERFVDTAVGAQLDIIGKLAGQLRLGLDDDTYRRYIRARIAANNSDGTVEDILTVADLIVYNTAAYLHAENQPIATVVLKVENAAVTEALANILIAFLKDSVSGGVRVILEYSSATPGNTFKWDTAGRGWDTGKPFLDAKD